MLNIGKRLAVFSIRENRGGSIWVRAGTAFVNKDGSLNVLLDVLPLDGKLHVREAGEKRDSAPSVASMLENGGERTDETVTCSSSPARRCSPRLRRAPPRERMR